MGCETNGRVRVNQFALVSYIQGPLGSFLDRLRLQLAPECRPHAHVTVLPPRPLAGPEDLAEDEIRRQSAAFHAFSVKLGRIERFEASDVIYIEVQHGARELRQMHRKLNTGPLQFQEPFAFHPHITLAQNLPPEKVAETLDLARRFWSEWEGQTIFPVEELSFVQNTQENIWLDLIHFRLATEPAAIVR